MVPRDWFKPPDGNMLEGDQEDKQDDQYEQDEQDEQDEQVVERVRVDDMDKRRFVLNRNIQVDVLDFDELKTIEMVMKMPNDQRLVYLARYKLETGVDLFED